MDPKVTLADDSNLHSSCTTVPFRYAIGAAESNGGVSRCSRPRSPRGP